jgi:FlaA1/EpsC-like NDP-sugar epimerase
MKKMKNQSKKIEKQRMLRVAGLMLADAVLLNLAVFLALYLRVELNFSLFVSSHFLTNLLHYAPVHTIVTLAMFALFKMYSTMWRFAGVDDVIRIVALCLSVVLMHVFGMFLLNLTMPRSLPFIHFVLLLLFTCASRLSVRLIRSIQKRAYRGNLRRTMLIGAGEAGSMMLNEFQNSEHSRNDVICIIDDNRAKVGQYLHGVRIVGTREDIVDCAKRFLIDEIVLAIPTVSNRTKREILEICQKTGCHIKTLPAIYQLANGDVSIQQMRNVQVEDLLGRDSVRVDLTHILQYVCGKTVLVTGGGGSIGSELCRQIARYKPKQLIIFDIYENNAYEIQQELRRNVPGFEPVVLIGSVRDKARVDDIFETYHPDLVYHAAAHKHVPLMEDSPNEAIKNNVFGTLNVARAADRFGASRFILVSTDKAVRPTNVMGASKRLCEMIIQMMDKHSKTGFVAVRFGNVLGSNGSVIPLFKRQIEKGGPVTVTHKDIIRYFMTIPEAVSLILQAGAYAQGGEIFVLDMGDPVRIDDLARNMIRLSGFEPDVDIEIVYTGLRPGEKLYEELLLDEEGLEKTKNELIYIGHPIAFDEADFFQKLDGLWAACQQNSDDIRQKIRCMVPEFHPNCEQE